MEPRLAGRRILITGAAGGQGRAVARRLLDEGALVALSDVAADRLEHAADELGEADRIAICPADVRDERAVRGAVEHAVATFGGLDGLYNNAGVYLQDRDAPVDRLELDVWDSVFAINTTGMFLFCKHAVPALLEADAGVLVNVSSTAGHAGDAACHAYAASKGALIALTLSIARRWGADGLRAVTLCPGFIETPMVDFAVRDPAVAGSIRSATALARLGRPEEIAGAAAFLLSDDASFVTACTVDVHGGLVK
jgi:NAD(P)-dependent dehydrogenase (short-subunit alcohol dehydrogenase family)